MDKRAELDMRLSKLSNSLSSTFEDFKTRIDFSRINLQFRRILSLGKTTGKTRVGNISRWAVQTYLS